MSLEATSAVARARAAVEILTVFTRDAPQTWLRQPRPSEISATSEVKQGASTYFPGVLKACTKVYAGHL